MSRQVLPEEGEPLAVERRPPRYLFALREPYPPFRPDTVELFGHEMLERGHEIHWLFQARAPETQAGKMTWKGWVADVVGFPAGQSFLAKARGNLKGFLVDLKMIPLVLKGGWDFIQVRDRFFGGCVALALSRLSGCPFVFWLSFPFPEMYRQRARERTATYPWVDRLRSVVLHWLLYRVIAPGADHLIVQSPQMQKVLVDQGVRPEKMTAIPMGVAARRAGSAARAPSHTDQKSVVYLGSLAQDRKLDFLVRVHKRVVDVVPGAVLRFIGKGERQEDEALLVDEARRLGIENNIVLTGFLPTDAAFEEVRAADICVSPIYPSETLNMGSPTKLIEYMLLGRPVVANDHPEQLQILEDSGAGLCTPWDEQAFAAAVIELLTQPERAEQMAARGPEYVRRERAYSVLAERLDQCYRRLLACTTRTG